MKRTYSNFKKLKKILMIFDKQLTIKILILSYSNLFFTHHDHFFMYIILEYKLFIRYCTRIVWKLMK